MFLPDRCVKNRMSGGVVPYNNVNKRRETDEIS